MVTGSAGAPLEGTDEALVREYVRAGDRAALEALLRRRWPEAYRLALRALGDPAAAEDAAQEAFVALVRGAGSFEPGRPFGPWFRTLVMNAVRMIARAGARRRRREEEVAARRAPGGAAGGTGDREGERRLEAEEVEEHVRALPVDVRFALILHFYEGRSHEEVAEVLGCPKGTAASRIRRGLERLRESLARAGYGAAVPSAPALEALLAAGARAGAGAAPVPPAPSAAAIEAAAAAAEGAATGALLGALKGVVLACAVAAAAAGAWLLRADRAPAPAPAPAVARAPASPDGDPAGQMQPGIASEPASRASRGQMQSPVASGASTSGARPQMQSPVASDGGGEPDGAPPEPAPEEEPSVVGRVLAPDGTPVAGALVVDATAAERALPGTELEEAIASFFHGPVAGVFAGLEPAVATRMAGPEAFAFVNEIERGVVAGTDVDGRFVLRRVPPGPRRLVACARGQAPASAVVEVLEGGPPAEATLHLGASGAVEGTVRRKDGAPAAGAAVTLLSGLGEMAGLALVADDGTYRIAGVPGGTYSVFVLEAGSISGAEGGGVTIPLAPVVRTVTVAAGETARLDIPGGTERGGATVRGAVRVGGVPLETKDAMLILFRSDRPLEGYQMTVIQPGGRFRFDGVLPGRYYLLVSEHALRQIEVPEGAAEVPIDLDLPSHTIAGEVVDGEGRPLAGVAIEATREEDPAVPLLESLTASEETDAAGRFEIAGLDEGRYLLTARLEGHVPARAGPVSATSPAPLRIVLVPGGTIRATIVGPRGDPVTDGYLVVVDPAGGERAGAEKHEPWLRDARDGDALAATGVPPGVYDVTAGSWRGSFERRRGVRFDGTDLALDFVLAPGGTVEVLARDAASGAPVTGARLSLTFPDGARLPTDEVDETFGAPSGADGVARRERLAAGRYAGLVVAPDGRSAAVEVEVRDEATTRLAVDLR